MRSIFLSIVMLAFVLLLCAAVHAQSPAANDFRTLLNEKLPPRDAAASLGNMETFAQTVGNIIEQRNAWAKKSVMLSDILDCTIITEKPLGDCYFARRSELEALADKIERLEHELDDMRLQNAKRREKK